MPSLVPNQGEDMQVLGAVFLQETRESECRLENKGEILVSRFSAISRATNNENLPGWIFTRS